MSAPRHDRGFSLLEILVAFVILSLAMGVIMRLFSSGLGNVGKAEHYSRSAMLAESVFVRLGVESPLSVGELTGEDELGYRWRAQISEYVPPGADPRQPSTSVGLYQIDLDVTWSQPDDQIPGLRFTTLRTFARP